MALLSPEQIRGARGMLGWSQTELGNRAGLSLQTIKRMEQPGGTEMTRAGNLHAVQAALEEVGVVFEFRDDAVGVLLKIAV